MKKRFIVGVDISKDKLNIAIRDYSTREVILELEIKNTEKSILKFIEKYIQKDRSEYVIIMEATGVYGLELLDLCQIKKIDICVLNPLIISNYSKSELFRAKTDKFDAKIISKYGCEKLPELSFAEPRDRRLTELVSLLKSIEDLIQVKTSENNRLHSAKLNKFGSSEVIKTLTKLIKCIDKEIERLTDIALKIAKCVDKDYFDRLKRIPGVGEKVAMVIIAYFYKFEMFEKPKQVASYAGVNPRPYESGSSVKKKGGISKKGCPLIRKIIFMGSLSAKKYNNSCKNIYERLISKGKSKKTALVAVSNKLLRQIFAIGKYGREWNQDYCPKPKYT
ncbi:MAG: IS110 family transposase [Clostridiales bacterium]|nr:IS110 family transposase [Clostridiales bacterium]